MPDLRSTKQRRAIMAVFNQNKYHLAAEDVYSLVREAIPRISLGTVYRNLETLSQQGDLFKTVFPDGKARYELSGLDHHHHMVCLGCSNVVDISECPFSQEVREQINKEGFEAIHHRFEVFGFCQNCRQKDSDR